MTEQAIVEDCLLVNGGRTEMENKKLIERFEAELAKVDRPGVDKLLA